MITGKPTTIRTVTDLDAFRAGPWGPPAPGHPPFMRSLWAPYDEVHGALVALANTAKRSLVIAMFGFTDAALADTVRFKLNAPAIHCQVTLDKTQAGGPTEKAMLEQFGLLESNSVVVGTSEHGSIMHRKVMIVDGRWLVTGSTNWSLDAEAKQDNHLVVVDDATVAAEARAVLDLEHVKALTKAGR